MHADQILHDIVKKHWGYDRFLPLQKEAMECVRSGRDSVVVLPTGGGKSLCFQAPALAMPGLAVVVSPLISLMKDQVDALTGCGVPAACVNSTLNFDDRRSVAARIRSGQVKLLYVAPERLTAERFIAYLKENHVSFIAVDEAHCISTWGHDFRPEYRQLSILKESFPGIGVHAYTATATAQVRDDIARQLRLDRPEVLVGSFDRPNLVYRVRKRKDLLSQVCAVLDRYPGASGIIYCIRRKDVDDLCAALQEKGYRALPYHAGMNDEDRKNNQEAFIREQADMIVATVAFGMGIDKSNVRYVIHARMPKSLEYYQQESGRAGRDGLEGECYLFYSGSDFMVWKRIQEDSEPEVREIALSKLNDIYDFCTGLTCRHQAIVSYFGQDLNRPSCGACDVCLGEMPVVQNSLLIAQKILSCVLRLGERFGADYTSAVLVGARLQKILDLHHEKLSTWGALSDESKLDVRSWIEQLTAQGYLRKDAFHSTLSVTLRGQRLLKGQETPRLLKSSPEGQTESLFHDDSWEGVDKGLFEVLRQLRLEIAMARNVPSYIIFDDAALRDMARRRPSTTQRFLDVHGVGEKKCEDFGAQFVQAIVDYCRSHSVEMDQPPIRGSRRRVDRIPNLTRRRAFEMFKQGRSVEDVATGLDRSYGRTMQYLAEHIQRERLTDPTPWVDSATCARVCQTAAQIGMDRLKPIFDALEGSVSYDVIRVCLACLRNAGSLPGR